MAADNCRFSKGVKVNGFDDVPRPFLIGVGGGTASGKTTVCNNIMEQLGQNEQQQKQVAILSMESFYVPPTAEQETLIRKGQYNFDHPSAFDDGLLLSTLRDIKAGKRVRVPEYDFANNCRKLDTRRTIEPVDVILFEGILTFYFKEVRELFDMKLFVDTDPDTRLSRREIANKNSKFRNRFLNYLFNDTKPLYIVMRDMKVWGRDLDQILYQYTNFVKPAFEDFCLPTKKYADVIIPRGADNKVAIDLIVQHIQELLKPNRHSRTRRVRHNSDNMVKFTYTPREEGTVYVKASRPH